MNMQEKPHSQITGAMASLERDSIKHTKAHT